MSRKLFLPPTGTTTITTVVPPDHNPETVDIDILLHLGLRNISRMMNHITESVKVASFDRETVQNLKDLMVMLGDLKKKEADLLDTMTDAELENLTK